MNMSRQSPALRINIGIVVLIFIGVLFVLVYSLKRDYWNEVH